MKKDFKEFVKQEVNSKGFLERTKAEEKRVDRNFTLSGSVFDKFKDNCSKKELIASRVVDELMKLFNEVMEE